MPAERRTSYHLPIPLRDNEIDGAPNPYTRLEAVECVRSRLETLVASVTEVADQGYPPDLGPAGVNLLEELGQDLAAALYGQAADVGRVRRRPAGAWLVSWGARLWRHDG